MIPFYQPYFDRTELAAALHPGQGREDFELAVARAVGAAYGVAFAYGRSGLFTALKAMELEQSEVVMPAYTCAVVAQAVVASGNRPVFVDIDPYDFNMNIAELKNALTSRTRVILATHLYGYAADVDAIRSVAGDHRIVVIEDRAQSMFPVTHGSDRLQGDLALCSFSLNKQLSSVQGGVIATRSPDLGEKIRSFRDREMNQPSNRIRVARWTRFVGSYLAFRQPAHGLLQRARNLGGKRHYDEGDAWPVELLPRDYAAVYTGFQARIGLVQLGKWDGIVAKRRDLAQLYDQELARIPGVQAAPVVPGATFSYYTLRVPQRDQIDFCRRLRAQGVGSDQAYSYALPYLRALREYARAEYPCALQAAREVVNLPIYPGLSTQQALYVAACVRRSLSQGLEQDLMPSTVHSQSGEVQS